MCWCAFSQHLKAYTYICLSTIWKETHRTNIFIIALFPMNSASASYLASAEGVVRFHNMVLHNAPEYDIAKDDVKVLCMQDLVIPRPLQRKYGINIFTGENIAFKLSTSTLPDQLALSFATISKVIGNIPGGLTLFASAYTTYFSKVTGLLRYANNVKHVCGAVEELCILHFRDTREFYSLFSDSLTREEGQYGSVDKAIRMWLHPFFDGMDEVIDKCKRSREYALCKRACSAHPVQTTNSLEYDVEFLFKDVIVTELTVD